MRLVLASLHKGYTERRGTCFFLMRLVRDWDKLKSPIVIQKTIVSLLMYLDPVGLLLLVYSCMALCKLDIGKGGSMSACGSTCPV